MAELEQVPAGVIEEFSTRRRQIYGARRGASGGRRGARGRGAAADDSRHPRGEGRGRRARLARPHPRSRRGARARVQASSPSCSPGPRPRRRPSSTSTRSRPGCSAAAGLTATQNTFAEQDVVIAVAAAHAQGATAGTVIAHGRPDAPLAGGRADPRRRAAAVQHPRAARGGAADRRAGRRWPRPRGSDRRQRDQVERALAELQRPLTDEQAGAVSVDRELGESDRHRRGAGRDRQDHVGGGAAGGVRAGRATG